MEIRKEVIITHASNEAPNDPSKDITESLGTVVATDDGLQWLDSEGKQLLQMPWEMLLLSLSYGGQLHGLST